MKLYIKDYGWGFLKQGKGTRFLLGFSRIRPGQRGIKAELKRKKTQCTQAGQNTYIWVAKPGISKSEVAKQVLTSIRLDCTAWTLEHVTRCQSWWDWEKVTARVPCLLCIWAGERLEQGSCGGGTAVQVSLGRGREPVEASHARLEKPLQSLFIKTSHVCLTEGPTGKNN